MTDPRPEIPYAADERTTLLTYLDWFRETVRLKTGGLTAAELATTHPPSSMTLGGMLKHLAYVEDWWFGVTLLGRTAQPPFDDVDWAADNDWDWHSAAGAAPEELRGLFDRCVSDSEQIVAAADSLDALAVRHTSTGDGISLRWILVHMLEEYARHLGHADLIRESIDGSVGE